VSLYVVSGWHHFYIGKISPKIKIETSKCEYEVIVGLFNHKHSRKKKKKLQDFYIWFQ
jgi:hypothetical protein